MTIELTLQTSSDIVNELPDSLIATHPDMELKRSTCEKLLSFKLRLAFRLRFRRFTN
jgi:hypothetical protein